MARTPLTRQVQKQFALHRLARALGRSVEAVREDLARAQENRARAPISRRRFLAGAAAAGGGLALGGVADAAGRKPSPGERSIAIVGAGLAGLAAAVTLADAGYSVKLYEASPTGVGGRTQSDWGSAQSLVDFGACASCHAPKQQGDTGAWADNQVTHTFGELIDTSHTTMRALAARFGLDLVDALEAEPAGSTDTYWIGGYYSKAQADADFEQIAQAVHADLTAAGYPTTYDHSKPGGRMLDNLSVHDWIETRVPGGRASRLGKLLDVAYTIEYGLDTWEQSSLNLLYLLAYGSRTSLQVFGPSDERFRMVRGIGELPLAMAKHLGWDATIQFGHWIESIRKNSDGRYTLFFDCGGRAKSVVTDYVLLALPFAVLRSLDYSQAGFDPLKHRSIQELGRGKNGKLQLQFTQRFWNRSGPWGLSNGTCFSDDPDFQGGWDPTRGALGTHGILVSYTGGSFVDQLQQNHPYGNASNSRTLADASKFLRALERIFPGCSQYWNGKVGGAMPNLNPRSGASYPCPLVGQYQSIVGYEGVPQGNVYFAGDHTSTDFQGWMEGAARSGIDAGNALIARLR